jgi:hypothetical protein
VPSALRSLALIELRNSNEDVKLGEINLPLDSLEEIARALDVLALKILCNEVLKVIIWMKRIRW